MKTEEDKDANAPLFAEEPDYAEIPAGVDRRTFLMRSAVIGSAAVIAGIPVSGDGPGRRRGGGAAQARGGHGGAARRGEEVQGPGHDGTGGVLQGRTRDPRARTPSARCGSCYDFYQRCTKLPADQLAKATGIKVHLYGSLSATGKGHGTERAALAGLIGKEPATVDPLFLDEMTAKPDQTYPRDAGGQDLQRLAHGHRLRRPQGELSAPQHHDLQADGRGRHALRARVLLGRRRLHRMEGLPAARRRGSPSTPTRP